MSPYINISYIKHISFMYMLLTISTLPYKSHLYAQSLKVQYLLKFHTPESAKQYLSAKKIQVYKKSDVATNWFYSLTICTNYSYWTLDSVVYPCSIRIQSNNRPIDYIQFDTSSSKIKYRKIHFDTTNQFYSILPNKDTKYRYQSMEWDIDFTSQKIILGHKCFRAKHKYRSNLEVWFTPEIPTKYGPKDLNGLPGLILEVHHIIYDLYLININPSDPSMCDSLAPFNCKSVSQKNFNEQLRNYQWSINAHDPCDKTKNKP